MQKVPSKPIIFYPSYSNNESGTSQSIETNLSQSFLDFNKTKLPPLTKNGRELELFDYEIGQYCWKNTTYDGVIPTLEKERMVWIKKAAGLGITEVILRYIVWKAKCTNEWKNSQVIIVTGPNFDLAIKLIERIKAYFPTGERESKLKAVIGTCTIQAFPSHHLESVRSLTNPKFIFFDEADFFPPSQRNEALAAIDHYLAKSLPQVALVSTPNLPGGLFEQIERDTTSQYAKMFLHYEIGLGKIYTNEEIELAKKGGSFRREYGLEYGMGVGNLYPYQLVDLITESYDLSWKGGSRVRFIDPAYSNDELRGSKFALMEAELLSGIIYIREASQYARASPSAMQDLILVRNKTNPMVTLVDSAHPGLINDLVEKGVSAEKVLFNQELSNMTTEGTGAVKEKRVRIHPAFNDLIYQLKSVTSNQKGHPDKKKLTFDLGDCFQGICNYFKKSGTGYSVVVHDSPYRVDEDDY